MTQPARTREEKLQALIAAVEASDMQATARLLDEGAPINGKLAFGKTALMAAAHNCDIDMITLLKSHGASLNLKDDDGETALIYALANSHLPHPQRMAGVSALLLLGANPHATSEFGTPAFHYACLNWPIEDIRDLVGFGMDPRVVNQKTGETALHIVQLGKERPQEERQALVQMLLNLGVDIAQADHCRRSPEAWAIQTLQETGQEVGAPKRQRMATP